MYSRLRLVNSLQLKEQLEPSKIKIISFLIFQFMWQAIRFKKYNIQMTEIYHCIIKIFLEIYLSFPPKLPRKMSNEWNIFLKN